jgi:hypothetical protein
MCNTSKSEFCFCCLTAGASLLPKHIVFMTTLSIHCSRSRKNGQYGKLLEAADIAMARNKGRRLAAPDSLESRFSPALRPLHSRPGTGWRAIVEPGW